MKMLYYFLKGFSCYNCASKQHVIQRVPFVIIRLNVQLKVHNNTSRTVMWTKKVSEINRIFCYLFVQEQ